MEDKDALQWHHSRRGPLIQERGRQTLSEMRKRQHPDLGQENLPKMWRGDGRFRRAGILDMKHGRSPAYLDMILFRHVFIYFVQIHRLLSLRL